MQLPCPTWVIKIRKESLSLNFFEPSTSKSCSSRVQFVHYGGMLWNKSIIVTSQNERAILRIPRFWHREVIIVYVMLDARFSINLFLWYQGSTFLPIRYTYGVFQKSELACRTIAEPVILTMKNAFFQEFLLKHHLPRVCNLGFDESGRLVLIKNEILIILYFPIAHNTLCLPPEFCINHCF